MAEHATFSPSAAERWMNSPGCWQAEQGLPDEPSPYAALGTFAHAVAEVMLRGATFKTAFAKVRTTPVAPEGGISDADRIEMAPALAIYEKHCRAIMIKAPDWQAERQVHLNRLVGGDDDCWGTADFMAYSEAEETLYVSDLKYGAGVVVEAQDNPQLKIYAAAALGELQAQGKSAKHVVTSIVQPRVSATPKTAEYTAMELMDFGLDVLDAIAACKEPNAPCVPGPWVRFCKAKGACKELREQALSAASAEFATTSEGQLRDPADLTNDQLGELLAKGEYLAMWLDTVRKEAFERAAAGKGCAKGFKLVNKRATRVWVKDAAATIRALRKDLPDNVKPKDFYVQKFMSPAQVEKTFGKAVLGDKAAKLVQSVSSGMSLVPESDKRPAVAMLGAADEFKSIPNDNA